MLTRSLTGRFSRGGSGSHQPPSAASAGIALIVGHALRFALAGCLAGLVAAVAAGPAIGSLLFGITPTDPLTLVVATSLLITAVIVAAYLPARRASAVDPALSLRCD